MHDTVRLSSVIAQVIGDMPHPDAPAMKVRDYKAHVKSAQLITGKDEVAPADVSNAYHLLRSMDMSPSDFEHTWSIAHPVAQRFLGREPLPQEIKQLTGQHPGDVHSYYAESPHPDFPEIQAGDFARYYHAAEGIAVAAGVKRKPLPIEVTRFAMAGYDAEDIQRHYTQKVKPQNA